MTKHEVEKAIHIVMGDVIEECIKNVSFLAGEEKERVLEIARNAEKTMVQLKNELSEVKGVGDSTINHPVTLRIQEKLNSIGMEYIQQLRDPAIVRIDTNNVPGGF